MSSLIAGLTRNEILALASLNIEPESPIVFIARQWARNEAAERERERRSRAESARYAAHLDSLDKPAAPPSVFTNGQVRALARMMAPEFSAIEKRLGAVEGRTTGTGEAPASASTTPASAAGTTVIAAEVRNYIDARLNPLAQQVHELGQDTMKYRGVYQPGRTYQRGEAVTLNGGLWFALETTDARPGKGGDWKLTVKSAMAPEPKRDE